MEDYLEMVSFLADEGVVRVTDIAAHLGVSKPSVLTALRSLEEQGLVIHERYGAVTLSGQGFKRAQEIRDRHHFLTSFLISLGVRPETAEEDACKMEHVLSEETISRMKDLLKRQELVGQS
jgi:DtxR family Mn-dependent transcriptional regulator